MIFTDNEKKAFKEYMLSKGFRDNGAEELIRRLEENRAYIDDLIQYRSFKDNN